MPFGFSVRPEKMYSAAKQGDLEAIVEMLKSSWPSILVLNEALSRACANGQLRVAQHLLLHGAAIEPAQLQSTPALYSACEGGHPAVAREMLRRGAHIDRITSNGDTALGRAAFNGKAEVVRLLLEHHASLEATEGFDETPLQRAIAGDDPNKHPQWRWAVGDWPESIRLLKESERERGHLLARPRELWQKVRDAAQAWPYARHWLAEHEARRPAREPGDNDEGELPPGSSHHHHHQQLDQAQRQALPPVSEAPPPAEDGARLAEDAVVPNQIDSLRMKLADGHLLAAGELAHLEAEDAAAVAGLREKLADGHLLTVDELVHLEEEDTAAVAELRERLADGHLFTNGELERLEEEDAAAATELREGLADGHLLSTSDLEHLDEEEQHNEEVSWRAEMAAAAAAAAADRLQEQLRDALAAQHTRVLDLFRSWDLDSDGTIRKPELRRAALAVGINAPESEVDALFDVLDVNHSGQIEYRELNKALRRGQTVQLDASLAVGAVGSIELKAKNKSSRDDDARALMAKASRVRMAVPLGSVPTRALLAGARSAAADGDSSSSGIE